MNLSLTLKNGLFKYEFSSKPTPSLRTGNLGPTHLLSVELVQAKATINQ